MVSSSSSSSPSLVKGLPSSGADFCWSEVEGRSVLTALAPGASSSSKSSNSANSLSSASSLTALTHIWDPMTPTRSRTSQIRIACWIKLKKFTVYKQKKWVKGYTYHVPCTRYRQRNTEQVSLHLNEHSAETRNTKLNKIYNKCIARGEILTYMLNCPTLLI